MKPVSFFFKWPFRNCEVIGLTPASPDCSLSVRLLKIHLFLSVALTFHWDVLLEHERWAMGVWKLSFIQESSSQSPVMLLQEKKTTLLSFPHCRKTCVFF